MIARNRQRLPSQPRAVGSLFFFYCGFAIHGTYDLARLGGPASRGCVRLHPSNAAALFELVERNTRIEITNWQPPDAARS